MPSKPTVSKVSIVAESNCMFDNFGLVLLILAGDGSLGIDFRPLICDESFSKKKTVVNENN